MSNITYLELPDPSPGTQRRLMVCRYGTPGARPRAYLHAGLHADEHPGIAALHELRVLLEDTPVEQIPGEIIIVPVANPVGLGLQLNGYLMGRFAFDGSGNFNRGFVDLSEAAAERLRGQLRDDVDDNTALIRRVLGELLDEQIHLGEIDNLRAHLLRLAIDADIALDIHCDDQALLHLYASRHQLDIAQELAADTDAAVLMLEDNPGGQPFDETVAGPWWKLRRLLGDEYPIPLGCFSTTLELRGQADVSTTFARQDAAALYRFLQRRGVIAGDPGPAPGTAATLVVPLEGVDIPKAPTAGLVIYRKSLGDWVQRGEVVAELIDPLAEDPRQGVRYIESATEGRFFTCLNTKLVRPGQSLCKIAGETPLAHRRAGQLLQP